MKTHFTLSRMASVLLLAWIVAGCSVDTRSGPALEIGVTGRANANASIASSGSFVGVVWAARTKDGVTDVYVATSRDGGRAFGAPVRVNQVPGDASVSGEQPPRIVLSARGSTNPAIVVLWTAKSASGTRLVSARSTDGGKSFGQAESVPGSDASGNRGWESAAVTPNGDVVAVWLDHREVPARTAGASNGRAPARRDESTTSGRWGCTCAALADLFRQTERSCQCPRDRSWCLLLLQDLDRDGRERDCRRGLATRVPREHSRHRAGEIL